MRNGDRSEEERKQAAKDLREKVNEMFSPETLSQPIHHPGPVTPDHEDEARHPKPNDEKPRSLNTLKIGDLHDGGVYVGLSAEDGKPLHAALADEPKYLTVDEAIAAAETLKALHPTAHVPTPKELNKNLFVNRFTG